MSRVSRAAVAALMLAAPGAVLAQEADPVFSIELNAAADTTTGSCRLTYVASNQSDIALERTAYEIAVFDQEGTVSRLLVLEFGALIEGKTKVLQFDLSETPCAGISRIVVNTVTACTRSTDGAESAICLANLAASSRTAIQFGI